ncbi:MAG: hypothetical protein QXS37_05075 [Candidatus Aenigmatarchaeota archaeon]
MKKEKKDIVEIGKAIIMATMTVAIIGIMFSKEYLKIGISLLGLIIVSYIVYKMVSQNYSKK